MVPLFSDRIHRTSIKPLTRLSPLTIKMKYTECEIKMYIINENHISAVIYLNRRAKKKKRSVITIIIQLKISKLTTI